MGKVSILLLSHDAVIPMYIISSSSYSYLQQLDIMSNTYGQDLPDDAELTKEQQEQLDRLRNEVLNSKE